MLDYSCNKMEIIIGKKALQKTWKYSTENTEINVTLKEQKHCGLAWFCHKTKQNRRC